MAATLPVASREGRGSDMPVRIKLPPCFGSSKRPKTELLWEPALARGPLWKNTKFIECDASGEVVPGQNGKPLCQELMINMASPGGKLEYTPTEQGCALPLTLVACRPGWDDYLDLSETVMKMANCLMEEDGQQVLTPYKTGTTPKQKDVTQVTALPPSDDVTLVSASEFPGTQSAGSSHENPVHLSDATEASISGSRPMKDTETEDEAITLGHFNDALNEMAASIVDLEDGYFKALHEVIIETEKALRDMLHIDAHYVSRMVTVMNSWQEVVQTATSHMGGCRHHHLSHALRRRAESNEGIRSCSDTSQSEECDATHEEEQKRQKEAIKTDDFEDPVVCLLHVTRKVARTQAEKAVDAFLGRIKSTLQKHVPVNAQGPLIANALSMAFQFQMSMWRMIGEECIRPMRAKLSDWCSLAGIIQAIVETFPKNCALMFPPAPVPPTSFAGTFRPASSDENDDNDMLDACKGFRRFGSSFSMPSDSGRRNTGGFSLTSAFISTPLPHRGAFVLVSDPKETPSSALGASPGDKEDGGPGPIDEELDMGLEADGDKEPTEGAGDESVIDPGEIKLLKGIIKAPTGDQPSTTPKSGDKRGSSHLDGGFGSSDSSIEDLDASRGTRAKKKGRWPQGVASKPVERQRY